MHFFNTAKWVVAAALLWLPATATAAERIQSYDVDVTINKDASIDVREHITYDFGSAERHGIFRTFPTSYSDKDNVTLFLPVDVKRVVDEDGNAHEYTIEAEDDYVQKVRIGDPDKTITGVHDYVIEYHIDNVINGFTDHDEFYWNVTGDQWQVPINEASATIHLPGSSQQQRVRCFTGIVGSTSEECTSAFDEPTRASFAADNLLTFEGLTVVVGFDKGLVTVPAELTIKSTPRDIPIRVNGEKVLGKTNARVRVQPGKSTVELKKFAYDTFRVADTFEAGHTYTITAKLEEASWALLFQLVLPFFLLVATTLGLFWLWLVRGRDHEGRATIVPQYEEPDGLTAGEVGVLIDQKVHRHDISASLIQLAVRGYVHLTKLDEKKQFGVGKKNDYTLTKQKSFSKKDAPELQPHERKILKGIFGSKTEVKLSDLNNKFYKHLPKIKDDLYDSMVTHKYFTKHPNTVRRNWRIMAVVGFVIGNGVGIAMASLLEAPAYGVVFGLMSIQVLVYSFVMPQRTKVGTYAYQHVLGLKEFMKVTEKERMKFHFDPKKIKSSKELFERLLPYAMVLKVEEEWAKQFPELEEPDWYSGSGDFSPLLFTQTMSSFSSAASAAAVSTPGGAGSGGSGFSGGGFSGGGFGGGGGGSW